MTLSHDLDLGDVDSLDEISGDEQLAFVWCATHRTYEWHFVDRDLLGTSERQKRERAARNNQGRGR